MSALFCYPFRVTGILSAHDFHWDNRFVFHGESHHQWEMVCVLDGQVEVAENENIYLLQPGDCICHAPMEFHRIRSTGETHPHVLVMSFAHEGTLPARLSDGVFSLTPQEVDRYTKLFYRIQAFYDQQEPDAYAAAQTAFALSLFLISLSQKPIRSDSRSHSRSTAEYRLLVRTMTECLMENASLHDLSLRTGVSISAMKKLFRNYAGMGPKTYYLHLRGGEALRLLKAGMPLQQIAETLNYSSVNYFSMCFKRQFGIPPGEYRRRFEDAADQPYQIV